MTATVLVRRVSTVPASPMRVLIDKADDEGNVGMTRGGSFVFDPAGSGGDVEAYMSVEAARELMRDPGLRSHFDVTPPLSDEVEVGDANPTPE